MTGIRRRLVPVTVAAALVLAVGSCSGESGSRAPASSVGHSARSSAGTSSSPAASAGPVSTASPILLAAAAVATRSRSQVVLLHAAGTSTAKSGTLPRAGLAAQGSAIRSQLLGQVRDATRLPPPAGSPAASLVSALRSYAELAAGLATWNPAGAALPRTWFARLEATDSTWKQALRALSPASGTDLLADLPRLIVPSS